MFILKTAVIHTGKCIITQTYASYIADGLDADVFTTKEALEFSNYDHLIFGSTMQKGELSIGSFLEDREQEILQKDAVLFTVTSELPNSESYKNCLSGVLSEKLKSHLRIYSFPEKINMSKLTFLDKMAIRFMAVASVRHHERIEFMNTNKKSNFNRADILIYEELLRVKALLAFICVLFLYA